MVLLNYLGYGCVHFLRQDYQMWLDLRNLESRINERYITHESDDLRWHHHAQLSGLDYPMHLTNSPCGEVGQGMKRYKEEEELETLSERVSELWGSKKTYFPNNMRNNDYHKMKKAQNENLQKIRSLFYFHKS